MSEGKAPAFRGNGTAVWLNRTKDGEQYLTIRILDSITVNAFKYVQKPKPVSPEAKPKDIIEL